MFDDFSDDEGLSSEQEDAFYEALTLVSDPESKNDLNALGAAHYILYRGFRNGHVPIYGVDFNQASDALQNSAKCDFLPALIELAEIHLAAHPSTAIPPTDEYLGLRGRALGEKLGIKSDLIKGIDLAQKVILSSEDHDEKQAIKKSLEDLYAYVTNPDQTPINAGVMKNQFNQNEDTCSYDLIVQQRLMDVLRQELQVSNPRMGLE